MGIGYVIELPDRMVCDCLIAEHGRDRFCPSVTNNITDSRRLEGTRVLCQPKNCQRKQPNAPAVFLISRT